MKNIWFRFFGVLMFGISCSNSSTGIDAPDFEQFTSSIEVAGTNLIYSVAIPKSYLQKQTPVPLILALHYGGTATSSYGSEFLNFFIIPALGNLKAIMVAPVSPIPGNWTNQASLNVVLALVDSIKSEYNIDANRMLVTGFSMGAIGTWYFAAKQSNIFTAAIPVSGMPHESVLPMLAGVDVPFYVIHSLQDEIFPFTEVEKVVQDLQAQGVKIEFKVVSGVSHYDSAGFIKYLAKSVSWLEDIWNN